MTVLTQFDPDIVTYGDMPGLGLYEDGHYRQHEDYRQVLTAHGVTFIPAWPILHMVGLDESQFFDWLNMHEMIHAALRAPARITGTDLSQLDPNSPEDWANWEMAHAYEHAAFDQAFAQYGLANVAN